MSSSAHWLYLVVAGLFEIGWPLGLKLASTPSMKLWGLLIAVVCMGLSGLFLWLALKGIPMGSAYAVWTGIGAAGTFLVGVFFFGDPSLLLRWLGLSLIVAGVVCLKLA
jgi:quaternary ammonium compound-resistance protein SugE